MIAGAGVSVAAIVGSFFYGRGTGKEAERLKWETANVETLVEANEGLAKVLTDKDQQITDLQKAETETGNDIAEKETRIIERIREVPIERVVRVDADCSIDYGLVGLRNSWATGNRIGEASGTTARSLLPDIGVTALPGDAGDD